MDYQYIHQEQEPNYKFGLCVLIPAQAKKQKHYQQDYGPTKQLC